MKSMSLYEEKHSFLNKLSPITKMIYVVAAILIPAFAGEKMLAVGFMIFSMLLLMHSKVIRRTFPILGVSGFVVLTVLIIQGLFRAGNETVVLDMGPVAFYKEGLLFALGIAINVFNIILCFCVLVLSTKPSDMVEELVRKGFSPRIGYVFTSLFQLIPQMTDRMSTITDAQKSRGMETEGSLMIRMKAFLPLISPVIMSSFIDTKERAIALEVRGFNAKNKKTFLNESTKIPVDNVIIIILVVGIVCSIGWRIMTWLR
ncbi:MAG: energy-coupling factor transporter transmembrane component T [Lachnospiraceae bacterium]|nr:energy-coupling factor transporter transmembrane component T [Lachnospiraceae bacterium]